MSRYYSYGKVSSWRINKQLRTGWWLSRSSGVWTIVNKMQKKKKTKKKLLGQGGRNKNMKKREMRIAQLQWKKRMWWPRCYQPQEGAEQHLMEYSSHGVLSFLTLSSLLPTVLLLKLGLVVLNGLNKKFYFSLPLLCAGGLRSSSSCAAV